jgi:hypothetical protein
LCDPRRNSNAGLLEARAVFSFWKITCRLALNFKKFIYKLLLFHFIIHHPLLQVYILPGSRCGLVELAFSSFVLSSRFLRAVVSFSFCCLVAASSRHHLGAILSLSPQAHRRCRFPSVASVVLWVDFSVSVAIFLAPLSLLPHLTSRRVGVLPPLRLRVRGRCSTSRHSSECRYYFIFILATLRLRADC